MLLCASPLFAQESENEGWWITVGAGPMLEPKFPGAKDLGLRPWPLFDLRRMGSEREFETPDEGFSIDLLRGKRFNVGPALNFDPGRDEEDAILGIGDVGMSVEGGAFVEAYLSDHFRLRGEARKGFGGHKGVVADVGADMIFGETSDPFHFSIGPRVRLANARYVRAYYGVNPAQSALTGLPVHGVSGGLHSVGALAYANYQLNRRWGIEAFGRWDRLLGDAADSPLVRSSVGSRNQFRTGIGLTYSFGLKL